ncbi:MAG: methyltransferase FkbM family [uncultured bacterium]|nr:MAG: methyltransferase FkbM family [uncultured bacterium]OGT14973.1 MAG: hypothetical protein A3B69_04525 [Gammaproteobacteria bacterium RIFCSPHIGHO2_02_FULL_38_33]OGT24139.1 MAG: hypothetical protein A2W47_01105 [Gammaproteobacteria bacterium RIFCSPHIGHO2_12_38_15]OGT67365.1 MAG: hypothetical protein A3I12_08210 [Gammaproteobacteria bacterium RIFCSPLOWO2_02_FULL_38_11]
MKNFLLRANRVTRKSIRKIKTKCYSKYCELKGYRPVNLFGRELKLSLDSQIFGYSDLKMPAGLSKSDIVQYADYVQFRSIVQYIDSLSSDQKPVFVDVGACHGLYVVMIGSMLKEKGGIVIAIEPDQENFSILKKNISLNSLEDTIICEQMAISDYHSEGYICGEGTQAYLVKNVFENNGVNKNKIIVSPLQPILEKFNISKIDCLLIDVEGAELNVLRSINFEKTHVSKIYCELHPYAWDKFGYLAEEMGEFLKNNNYYCLDMYLQEHADFQGKKGYIGPTLFIRI